MNVTMHPCFHKTGGWPLMTGKGHATISSLFCFKAVAANGLEGEEIQL